MVLRSRRRPLRFSWRRTSFGAKQVFLKKKKKKPPSPPKLTHNVRIEVHVVYDNFNIFAGHRLLSADSVVLFGLLDGRRRLLRLLRRLLQLLTVAAAAARKRISTPSGLGSQPQVADVGPVRHGWNTRYPYLAQIIRNWMVCTSGFTNTLDSSSEQLTQISATAYEQLNYFTTIFSMIIIIIWNNW